MKHSLLILGCGLLLSCSTYSRKDCETMNWHLESGRLAREGRTLQETKNIFAEKCEAEYGVVPDVSQVEEGFQKGLESLCTPEGAEQLADNGGIYRGTCAGAKESSFLTKYHTVRETHLERKISSLESEVSSLKGQKMSLESQISGLRSDLSSCRASSR